MKKTHLFLGFLIVAILTVVSGASPPAAADGITSWSQAWDTTSATPGYTIQDLTITASDGLQFSTASNGITDPNWTSSLENSSTDILSGLPTDNTFDFNLNFSTPPSVGGMLNFVYDIGSATYYEDWTWTGSTWTFDSSGDPPKPMPEPSTLLLSALGLAALGLLHRKRQLAN